MRFKKRLTDLEHRIKMKQREIFDEQIRTRDRILSRQIYYRERATTAHGGYNE